MSLNKKITLVISSLTGGGAERVCINIANRFVKNGWYVDLLVLNLNNQVHLDSISGNVNVLVLNVIHTRNSIIPLLKYFYKNKTKTFLVFNHELAVILVMMRFFLRLNIKIISRNISVLSIKIKQLLQEGFWRKYVVRPLVVFFYGNIDYVINQSQSMQDDLISVFPKLIDKSTVIYNPLSNYFDDYLQKYDPSKVEKKNYLLCVGRLEQVKAFHYAIEGFAAVADKFPGLRLKLVGQGNLEHYLKKKAMNCSVSDRVDFEGFQKNIIPYYLNAKATILTSLYEGYPNVLIESIAMNTPVIAFDSPGGIKEIIQNGLNGYLVNYQDIDDLKDKLSIILLKKFNDKDLKNSIKKNQIEYAFKNYEELISLFV